MEICKEEKENNLGVTENYRNKDRRRFSTCSFSTFPKISYCEADSETESVNTNSKSRKNSFFFLSSYEELNACRKFTPQIIVSSNGFQSLKENNRPSYNLSKEKTQNVKSCSRPRDKRPERESTKIRGGDGTDQCITVTTSSGQSNAANDG